LYSDMEYTTLNEFVVVEVFPHNITIDKKTLFPLDSHVTRECMLPLEKLLC
jgi:hypothetical protein